MGDYHRALMDNMDASGEDGCHVREKTYTLRHSSDTPSTPTPAPTTTTVEPISEEEALAGHYASTGYGEYRVYGQMDAVEGGGEGDGDVSEAAAMCASLEGLLGEGKFRGSDLQLVKRGRKEMEELSVYLTPDERAYCELSADPPASTAGRVAAKHAICKALSLALSSSYRDIEVLAASTQAPAVLLSGDVEVAAETAGLSGVKVTISHSGAYAIAAACGVEK